MERKPIHTVEFMGDGNAIVRRTDGSATMMNREEVPGYLLVDFACGVHGTSWADLPDPIHHWFSLSYANYLTLPRSVLQSMPKGWQAQFCAMLDEVNAACSAAGIELPDVTVSVRKGGQFAGDWLADYERGRRNVFTEGNVRGV